VEPRGLEPLTPCLQSKCATNCAMAPVGPSPIPREWPGRRTMVRPSSVMNQSQNRHSPTPHYVLHLPISYTWCGDEGSEAECGERSRGDLDPGGSNKPMRSCAPKPPKPPRHAQTESEVAAQHRFHERSHRVALTAESTYAVAHVVPARSHRLRAAATLHTPGAAASRTQARAAGGL
jgi:hypothetical protein